jgi:hypothetical protein
VDGRAQAGGSQCFASPQQEKAEHVAQVQSRVFDEYTSGLYEVLYIQHVSK